MIDNSLYLEDLERLSNLDLPWDLFENKCVVVSGGTGMIGRCFIDLLMYLNKTMHLNCSIICIGRNVNRAKEQFDYCWGNGLFSFVSANINEGIKGVDTKGKDCYFVHLASNTHPVAYSTEPVSTILTNILGLNNMFQLAIKNKLERFLFASSNEIYGENRGDCELFDEQYCGYIDCNTLRAGYPESKRCGEALCQAYAKQYNINISIARFTRSYGPTVLHSDTKALSQFLNKGLAKENIVLKSDGHQYYSYTYVADAVAGLLFVLLKGKQNEAYNIADIKSDITLKELAECVARNAGTKVVFEIPNEVEKAGFSKATKARLDGSKIKGLGWSMQYDVETGIKRTLQILKELR